MWSGKTCGRNLRILPAAILALAGGIFSAGVASAGQPVVGPYDAQVAQKIAGLSDKSPQVRARSAEALGFLRAYSAQDALVARLGDSSAEVRRASAMALAWCGGRGAVEPLLKALGDEDWLTRKSAHAALTNLTGMEFPFACAAPADVRAEQVETWRKWWSAATADRPPQDVLAMLAGPRNLALGAKVTASSTYRGPADVLTDGNIGPAYWQTKNVKPPQWCQIDLGRAAEISRVVVHQYADGYCMTEYELSASIDGTTFEPIIHSRDVSPAELVMDFAPRQARFVRVTSFASQKKQFPTTFYQVEIFNKPSGSDGSLSAIFWRQERGLRALGVLGGKGATEAILGFLGDRPSAASGNRPAVRVAIRSLGRLREEAGFAALVRLLDDPMWARNAADALGDFGDRRAVGPLLAAYPRYAKRLDGKDPNDVPRDDKMTFPSEDRMLETPYAIAYALCRLPLDDPADRQALRKIAPLIVANLPGDFDTYFLYQMEVGHRLTRHLLEQSGLRQEAVERAMIAVGQSRRVDAPADAEAMAWPQFKPRRMATILPALCTEKEDLPRLLALLDHDDGRVRMNAAKAIAWLGEASAIEPVAEILASAKAEADFGSTGQFKDEEYSDPCPRWRQALIRTLGILKAADHVDLLVKILNDERSVVEIRLAAAEALADIGSPAALAALRDAAAKHPFQSVRKVAREAIEQRGMSLAGDAPPAGGLSGPASSASAGGPSGQVGMTWPDANFDALVFIKGDNDLPNSKRTVEQADRWRQTYVVTDEGPVYRPGENLYILRPPRPDGNVTPLTRFPDGYVGEPELSWDAKGVIFTHRTAASPWWHLWRINADGSELVQLTDGPYHDVGPLFLGDGRIVFSSSRIGVRDEYHGYPCTALYVMNGDGSDVHAIAANIGRDNEPSLLSDGRIVFSRLEVFYSRNKTELTLHAVRADGTGDAVLYGPERRAFWRNLDHGPKAPDDGQEAPLTHRVLRMTQPQPMPDGQHIVVSTQGGLALVGPSRESETLICPDFKTRAYTTPFPLADGSILCASTLKTPDRTKVDLGLYRLFPDTGRLDLIYNDPNTADYEPRPIVARRPPVLQPAVASRDEYTGRLFCASVRNTQEEEVARRGKFIRLVEGTPQVARHSTHVDGNNTVWENHGGTLGRVLGTVPLADDGSFFIELPADRLVHLQVLDSDRRVVGNQLTWIYVRPGETKSCVGCHENPHTSAPTANPVAGHFPAVKFLPTGDEFNYRAKAWFKGSLPGEIEERTRTARAVNLLGR